MRSLAIILVALRLTPTKHDARPCGNLRTFAKRYLRRDQSAIYQTVLLAQLRSSVIAFQLVHSLRALRTRCALLLFLSQRKPFFFPLQNLFCEYESEVIFI